MAIDPTTIVMGVSERIVAMKENEKDLNREVPFLELKQKDTEFFNIIDIPLSQKEIEDMLPFKFLGTKLWRALVRVEEVFPNSQTALVIVPEWNIKKRIAISTKDIPDNIRKNFAPDYRCFAMVNTDAKHSSDLIFENWENIGQ